MGFVFIKVSGHALNLCESKDGCVCNHSVKNIKEKYLDFDSVSQLSS